MTQAGVRITNQERSAQRRRRIVDAAISVIADHGLAGVTHRLVAQKAHVSLAATTYYYETKLDLVADASQQLLAGYVEAFERFADQHRDSSAVTFRDFAMKLITNATGSHRTGTLAWCEIILDAARHQETRALANIWFAKLTQVWTRIAEVLRVTSPELAAGSAIDVVVGMLFTVVSLGLSEAQASSLLDEGAFSIEAWRPAGTDTEIRPSIDIPASSRKAEQTRERILSAAIAILISDGAAAVTYRATAEIADLTPTAPTYHYSTIQTLLAAAQDRLFAEAKDRYRRGMAGVDYNTLTTEGLTDLTAAVFLREATEFGPTSLASYPIWLEAARHPPLRPAVWSAVDDQCRAWGRLLERLTGRQRSLDALVLQALFVGKLVRNLATGSTIADLAKARSEFARDIEEIAVGLHWTQRSP